MKRILLSLALSLAFVLPIFAMNLPEPTGYVVDTIHLLNNNTVSKLTQVCKEFDNKAQVAVVIVDSTRPYSIEDYSIKLAEKFKVGYKGIDNGVILLLAKSDRAVRIEVGRGLEYTLTDARAGYIVNSVIIPYFKRGDWDNGLIAGVEAIKKEIIK